MQFDWQTGLALACVALAATVIARRLWSFLHPIEGRCGGGCSGCSGQPAPGRNELPVVSLSGDFRRSKPVG